MKLIVRLVTLLALLVAVAPGPCAAAPTRVVFTIDVESNDAYGLPDQVDAVCAPNATPCGLAAISNALKARGWSGTYFLNVYEYKKWGEAAIRTIAQRLRADGQDLALHTHPQWAYDPRRWAMSQYTLEEQTAIVKDGVQRLTAWSGQSVVAHRTGAYAADANTLIALERNGITLDSSVFWQHPNTRLDARGLPHNLPVRYGRLVEIPVTVYRRADTSDLLGFRLPPVVSIRKIDPNWFVNSDEMHAAMDETVSSDLPIVVVFLHSFSFMDQRSGSAPTLNRHAWDLFTALLDDIAKRQLPVVTLRQIATEPLTEPSIRDVVPQVVVTVDLPHYLWHRIKTADRREWGGIGVSGLLLAIVALTLVRTLWVRRVERRTIIAATMPKARFQ